MLLPKRKAFLLFSIIAFSCSSFLFSCTSPSRRQELVLNALNESIEASNGVAQRSTDVTYQSLEDKLNDPGSAYKAAIWHPKATVVRSISKKALLTIDSVKNELVERRDQPGLIEKLYSALQQYRHDIMGIDPGMTETFNTSLVYTTTSFDDTIHTAGEFAGHFFRGISVVEIKCLLNKFSNNIMVNENKLVQYCHNKVPNYGDYFEFYSALVGQSSTRLSPGETMEIAAGVGSFSKIAMPEIDINGVRVPLDETGVAMSKFRVSRKPGKTCCSRENFFY